MKKWLLLSIALYSANIAAFPRANPVPGGIALVPIAALSGNAPIVQYEGNRVTVVPADGQWLALVGIPLEHNSQHPNIASANG